MEEKEKPASEIPIESRDDSISGYVEPVSLEVRLSHICGEKVEQCCNYEIRGKGAVTLQLTSPTHRLMSHIRDTGVRWYP